MSSRTSRSSTKRARSLSRSRSRSRSRSPATRGGRGLYEQSWGTKRKNVRGKRGYALFFSDEMFAVHPLAIFTQRREADEFVAFLGRQEENQGDFVIEVRYFRGGYPQGAADYRWNIFDDNVAKPRLIANFYDNARRKDLYLRSNPRARVRAWRSSQHR